MFFAHFRTIERNLEVMQNSRRFNEIYEQVENLQEEDDRMEVIKAIRLVKIYITTLTGEYVNPVNSDKPSKKNIFKDWSGIREPVLLERLDQVEMLLFAIKDARKNNEFSHLENIYNELLKKYTTENEQKKKNDKRIKKGYFPASNLKSLVKSNQESLQIYYGRSSENKDEPLATFNNLVKKHQPREKEKEIKEFNDVDYRRNMEELSIYDAISELEIKQNRLLDLEEQKENKQLKGKHKDEYKKIGKRIKQLRKYIEVKAEEETEVEPEIEEEKEVKVYKKVVETELYTSSSSDETSYYDATSGDEFEEKEKIKEDESDEERSSDEFEYESESLQTRYYGYKDNKVQIKKSNPTLQERNCKSNKKLHEDTEALLKQAREEGKHEGIREECKKEFHKNIKKHLVSWQDLITKRIEKIKDVVNAKQESRMKDFVDIGIYGINKYFIKNQKSLMSAFRDSEVINLENIFSDASKNLIENISNQIFDEHAKEITLIDRDKENNFENFCFEIVNRIICYAAKQEDPSPNDILNICKKGAIEGKVKSPISDLLIKMNDNSTKKLKDLLRKDDPRPSLLSRIPFLGY
jgi:hypothetical protein